MTSTVNGKFNKLTFILKSHLKGSCKIYFEYAWQNCSTVILHIYEIIIPIFLRLYGKCQYKTTSNNGMQEKQGSLVKGTLIRHVSGNSFATKFKSIVWDFFHIQYNTSF